MNRKTKNTIMSAPAFAEHFPTLAAAIKKEDRMETVIDVVPVPVAEIDALRRRKEEGERIWAKIKDVRGKKMELAEHISDARVDVRDLEKNLEKLEEEEGELIAAHLFLDGGPGQGILPFGVAPEKPADGEAWKEVPVAALIDNAALVGKLVEAGLSTFGALEAWRAKVNGPGGEGAKIKGLGEAKMQLIEDAVVRYWEKNPAGKPADPEPMPEPVKS